MNSILLDQEFINSFYKFNPELLSTFSSNNNQNNIKDLDFFQDFDHVNDHFLNTHIETQTQLTETQGETISYEPSLCYNYNNNDHNFDEVPDFPDDCLKFISDILLEEDLDQNKSSPQDVSALEATEKSLYDVLNVEESIKNELTSQSSGSSSPVSSLEHEPEHDQRSVAVEKSIKGQSSGSSSPVSSLEHEPEHDQRSVAVEKSIKGSTRGRRKTHRRDRNGDVIEHSRSRKVQAFSNEDYVEMEQFDDVVLLCEYKDNPENKNRGSSKKNLKQLGEVDLMTLLIQCAQAVSNFDLRGASELLRQIRQFASPYGDSTQRLAHHVGNALEARLAGTGATISTNLVDLRISVYDFLKAYRLYVSAVPFNRMFYFMANCTIAKFAEGAKKIHIIDFGIFLGVQWPCLIQHLSKRSNGPPQIRITGVEYPQQGFRPAERVEATGRRLSGYCKRFGVPFEYKAIAQKWDSIKPEDLNVENDELVIVNCMGRSGTLLDETVDETNSQKDAFLRLVRNLQPDLFVHGVINGTFNAPFFVTRFKEALFHYLSIFDVFDATLPREAHERLLVESEIYGKELYNVIACEGVERVQRPESYKQWQVRSTRAGLRQVELDQELVSQAKTTVKANYNKEFVVDEDRGWMLQGWKGRTVCALSFWKPTSHV